MVDKMLSERISIAAISRVTGISKSWLYRYIAALNENRTGGHKGVAPVFGSGAFLFVNQVGLLYIAI